VLRAHYWRFAPIINSFIVYAEPSSSFFLLKVKFLADFAAANLNQKPSLLMDINTHHEIVSTNFCEG
jgi:hypothetical protein